MSLASVRVVLDTVYVDQGVQELPALANKLSSWFSSRDRSYAGVSSPRNPFYDMAALKKEQFGEMPRTTVSQNGISISGTLGQSGWAQYSCLLLGITDNHIRDFRLTYLSIFNLRSCA